eukprot:s7972_g1.t1
MQMQDDSDKREALRALDILQSQTGDDISYSSFLAAMIACTKLEETSHAAKSAFRRFDHTDSGYLSPSKLREVLGEDFDVEVIFKEVDRDQDGKINIEEFLAHLSDVQSLPAEGALDVCYRDEGVTGSFSHQDNEGIPQPLPPRLQSEPPSKTNPPADLEHDHLNRRHTSPDVMPLLLGGRRPLGGILCSPTPSEAAANGACEGVPAEGFEKEVMLTAEKISRTLDTLQACWSSWLCEDEGSQKCLPAPREQNLELELRQEAARRHVVKVLRTGHAKHQRSRAPCGFHGAGEEAVHVPHAARPGYNFSCADCSKSDVPPGFTKQGRVPVKAYICPATTAAGHICGQLLGAAEDCPLCAESRRYWSSEQVQEGWTSLPIFRKCELLQLDRILYEMEIIDPALSTTSHFMDSMNTITAGTDMENFTPQQWAAAWVARIMQPEIKPLLPLPRHTKLPWTVPNWDLESEDIVNCYGPLEDPALQQTFYIVSWFVDFLRSIWRTSGVHLAKQYELENWAASFDVAHSPLLPWPELIAASVSLAYEHAKHYCSSPAPSLHWTKDIFEWMLQPDFTKVTTDLFQVLAEEAAGLLDGDQILSLFKGEQPYTNKGAATAGPKAGQYRGETASD